ncbi:MAG: DUF2281 domain-containing protein [Cyanobacteria bacterium P01_D01_bin.105]
MTLESSILNNLKKLPEAMQQAVFLYTEFLVTRSAQSGVNQLESAAETSSNKRDGLGIWKNKIWIADDFDAPIDDFQEYM